MGSIGDIFSGLLGAITNGDIDITALLTQLLAGSAEQQQGGGGQ
ncbi:MULTISPECIES: hypothetical protein [Prescottella]|jgi:hypothetical protein|uniref:Uncharacterized protein n=2 Tax=Rhodococcus hoagii TaxID=43767 RepID=E9T008_RHOHA|nr:hypothetical protein [Prescottella equi]GBF13732.1 hypothetical protein Br6_01092 [Rhodococcus sp. Br-6]EGD24591.1 hypothetical protein HMPREF0724_11709 [Prescottella equi ATCC 33707]ERN45521.1 hypothetical protein H849_12825 [Prescottella equi NBRC 101255 = C 7]MDP8014886.1 hypothetical protein [Prescottella equi]WJJ13831.1 hypothetical protein P9990_11250 [Prescottella equi]